MNRSPILLTFSDSAGDTCLYLKYYADQERDDNDTQPFLTTKCPNTRSRPTTVIAIYRK
jgi:hypothetical protein